MNRADIIQALRERFPQKIIHVFQRSAKRVYVDISSDAIVDIATYLFRDVGARFNIASGVDGRTQMEMLYHFTVEDRDLVISLKVTLPKSKLEIDSLTPVFKAAYWIEREIYELLGIRFLGHPQLQRLLLPEDWPEGVYPLRKDYQEWDPNAVRDRGV
ncbi:MAG: NADH-quinone oxidoreductase subunit C [Candidatus Binatia bacterium]